MINMTKKERILAALNYQEVDRIPFSVWLHFPDQDQDPISLAETQVNFMKKFDLDFIKLMPFGLYGVQDWGCKIKIFSTKLEPAIVDKYAIKDVEDWGRIEVHPAYYGTLGKQVQLVQHVKKLLNSEDTPFVQTIFSPLTTARKLGGDRIFADIKENPDLIHAALQVITETTINFIKENIDSGVSGFFFATQCATTDLMTPQQYEEFGVKYDLQLFDVFKDKTYFNIIHIHGQNTMFEMLANYPGNCVNWHDRWVYPSISEARRITDKCILGGINENAVLLKASPEEIQQHVDEAVQSAGRKGFILGPGCCADPATPDVNYYAARIATQNY